MGRVFLAFDPDLERQVAIKVLTDVSPEWQARFRRETQIIASLNHPAILPVFDAGQDEGAPYLVMRHMPGGTLAEKLAAGQTRLLSESIAILQRLAGALDADQGDTNEPGPGRRRRYRHGRRLPESA